jgi:membrane protease YdiL (CAAX protease family)
MSGHASHAIDWAPIAAFVVGAVVISTGWAAWASLHGLLVDPASSGIYASVAQIGVLVSALAVIACLARPALGTIGWRPGPLWAYGIVFVAVSLVVAVSLGASFAIGGLALSPKAHTSPAMLAVSAPFMLAFTCLFSFGEEFGWRGFLLPKLMPLGTSRALVASGVIWFVWEAPLVWFGMLDGELGRVNMSLTLALHLVQNVAIAVAFGYLRLRFDSVFVPAFAHGLLNTSGGLSMSVLVETNPLLGDFDGPCGSVIIAAVGVFAWWLTRRAQRSGQIATVPNVTEGSL